MTQTERLILENQIAIMKFLLKPKSPVFKDMLDHSVEKTRKHIYIHESEKDEGH